MVFFREITKILQKSGDFLLAVFFRDFLNRVAGVDFLWISAVLNLFYVSFLFVVHINDLIFT
jgi:hypothetical protein